MFRFDWYVREPELVPDNVKEPHGIALWDPVNISLGVVMIEPSQYTQISIDRPEKAPDPIIDRILVDKLLWITFYKL